LPDELLISEEDRWTDVEEDWRTLAKARDHRCPICGGIVPNDERDVYLATGLCGWCRHQMEKVG